MAETFTTMDMIPIRRTVIIKAILAMGIFGLLILILMFSLKYRMAAEPHQQPDAPEQTKAELSINNFRHTATQNGSTQWTLEADAAEFFTDRNRVQLTDINFVFFSQTSKSEMYMNADSGILNLKTHDMQISSNVVIKNVDYRLETETLHYSHESNIISTDEPVNILGPAIQLKADTMNLDLSDGKLECQGNVKGTLNGTNFF